MKLLDLIKENLREEDKKVVSNIDFEKTNDEIIANIITAELLKFDENNHDDQKTRQNK